MNAADTIATVKQTVKDHTAIRFGARDIAFADDRLMIQDRYHAERGSEAERIMEMIGIRRPLIKAIFENPSESWPVLRDALGSIDGQKRIGAVADGRGRVVTPLGKAPDEAFGLDYDLRIDQLMDALDGSGHDFQNIVFHPHDVSVRVETVMRQQVEALRGDFWKFGTAVDLGISSNRFASYYLRLVCTNGMTTRENVASRQISDKANLARQFLSFVGNHLPADAIQPRVNLLRAHRASVHEANRIAAVLGDEDRRSIMPWYEGLVEDYGRHGHDILGMSVSRQKLIFTKQNAYDIFNLATYLASHHVARIGSHAAASLNQIAGEMFVKGPDLQISTLDIYGN